MRSLQDWTRYLEQQEQDLTPASKSPEPKVEEKPAPPPAPPKPVEPPRAAAPTPEVKDEAPAFQRVEREAPVAPEPVQPQPARPAVQAAPIPKPVEKRPPTPKPVPEPTVEKETIAKAVNLRKRLPESLDTDVIHQREIASTSYKAFKESREELIQRLVDPVLSLEEVARILNVCPTTVRRYTNRGSLIHHRTAGNQRRFRLSDVLAFMEGQSGIAEE